MLQPEFSPDDLNTLLDRALPQDVRAILDLAARRAAEGGWNIYLNGGYVRDLLLGRPNDDIDVSVVGDAVSLARDLQRETGAKLDTAERFRTAHLEFGEGKPHLDLVTARREWYELPGALPTVEPGNILEDLARRDFTINAMAIPLLPGGAGPLLDPHGGLHDLRDGVVRVLHRRSFLDDPTRALRAVKYANRLGFKLDKDTLELILQAVRDGAFGSVSMDRLVREVLLIMEEPNAQAMLAYLDRLGVLQAIHPYLGWPYDPSTPRGPDETKGLTPQQRRDTYLVILGAELAGEPEEAEGFARSLRLSAEQARLVHEAARLVDLWPRLGEPDLTPSGVYNLLRSLDVNTLRAFARIGALAAEHLPWQRLHDYLNHLRHVKTAVDGHYLQSLGVAKGPVYKRALDDLLAAKLDGEVVTEEEEKRFVGEWLRMEGLL